MNNIDIYYESLKQVYEHIVNWRQRKPPFRERVGDWFVGIFGVILALSFIPIVPGLILYIGNRRHLILGPIDLSITTIGNAVVVWVSTVILALLVFLLMIWIDSKVDSISEKPDRATQLLSPEQITFVAAYGAYKELKIFFVSHVDQHVKNSIKSINRLVTPEVGYLADQEGTSRMLYLENKYQAGELVYGMDESVSIDYPAEYRYRYSGRGNSSSFPNQIFLAKEFLRTFEKYDWFQIDQSTKSTLQAIISFPEKILFRLSGREDLPAVLSVLENLSKFTYAYLPEHKTYMDSKELEDLRSQGAICLANFVSGVNNLTSFALVKEDDTKERKGQSSVKERSQKWYYRSVFVRFTFWFILTSILTSLAVFLFNQRIPLSPDTMATIVIGGSIASAAALAGLLPRTSKPE